MNEDPSYHVSNPHFEEDIRERLKRQFFMKLVGFELTEIKPGKVIGELEIEEKHMQQNYFVHGGVMATCADIVMGFAAYSLLPPGFGVVTVDLQVSYLHPGVGTRLKAEGLVTKAGRNVTFCEGSIYMLQKGEWVRTNRTTATMYKVDAHLNLDRADKQTSK